MEELKKEAHWIPGDFQTLTALNIQVMNFLNGHTKVIEQNFANPKYKIWEVITAANTFFMIHSSRVMLCVLKAYFTSGMASSTFKIHVGKLASLSLSILLHVSGC